MTRGAKVPEDQRLVEQQITAALHRLTALIARHVLAEEQRTAHASEVIQNGNQPQEID